MKLPLQLDCFVLPLGQILIHQKAACQATFFHCRTTRHRAAFGGSMTFSVVTTGGRALGIFIIPPLEKGGRGGIGKEEQ
jgi:hypothetical protein